LKKPSECEYPPLQQTLARRALEISSFIGYTLSMKLSVTLDRDEDGIWVAECPAIPGCVSQGKTKPEALKNIKEAIALCLEVRAERGLPLTIETRQVEVAV
jgi:predicted RNase H-like HicB family nuclease